MSDINATLDPIKAIKLADGVEHPIQDIDARSKLKTTFHNLKDAISVEVVEGQPSDYILNLALDSIDIDL